MTENNIMTLNDFNEQILRPSVLNGIKKGTFDIVISNVEERSKCISLYSNDMEIVTAIVERYRFLNE